MIKIKHTTVGIFLAVLALLSINVSAQQRPYRMSDAQVQAILTRLENSSNRFRNSIDTALDRSPRYDGTRTEDNITEFVKDFEDSTDELRNRFNDRRSVGGDVQEVFNRAILIDGFMRRNRLTPRAQRDWQAIRIQLNQLSRAYGVAYVSRPVGTQFPGDPNYDNRPGYTGGTVADARLTGTYQIDTRVSNNPRLEADRATRTLPVSERQRVYDDILSRLDAPDQIALERRGNQITIASSRAPQVVIDANNRENIENYPNGRASRVRAQFYGDQLTITSTGDRASDFTVLFEPLGANQLRVTRTIYSDRLTRPVTVRSVYNKVANVARLDLYRGDTGYNNYPNQPNRPGTVTSGFVIPDGTTILAVLNNSVSTKEARDGDRFTMTVRDNSQYNGAIIEGTLSDVSRSGRITGRSGLTFNFDRIRLRDGRSYRFAGFVENIRTTDGENIKIDNEGTAQEDSQTSRTVQRAAIGTAVGALIGAIAGGGKGAAIGAAIGAGAGAGSVYVQGRDDLDLNAGSELTIRASSPR